MNKRRNIWLLAAVLLLAGAAALAVASFIADGTSNASSAAKALGRRVERRLSTLEGSMTKALSGEDAVWTELENLPADMVVYRYVEDTLQSWANRFPIRSDDIRTSAIVRRLGESRSDAVSPLKNVGPEWSFTNLGPKWYLTKSVSEGSTRLIAGLEIVDELRAGSMNGSNRRLKIPEYFSVKPLSSSVGAPVSVRGEPLFKLVSEKMEERTGGYDFSLQLLAIALLMLASLAFLAAGPSAGRLLLVVLLQTAVLVWTYLRGRSETNALFSPLLYADGPVLYSLGAIILQSMNIVLLVTDLYLVRRTLLREVRRRDSRVLEWVLLALGLLLVGLIGTYFHFVFKSIIINSDISLELYIIVRLSVYTAIVYGIFIALALCIVVLLQILSPLVRSLFGIRYDLFSVPSRAVFSAILGVYFVAMTAPLGFRKEERRIDVWANRLAMDRDVALEIQLRSVEGPISSDQMFGALAALPGGADVIRGRLVSNYMARISQDYDVSVLETGGNPGANPIFQERIRSGVRLSDNSNFFYSPLGNGRVAYTGIFTWYISGVGSTSMLVSVESKRNREDRGYLRLLGVSDPGRVSLPSVYSWAKYVDGNMVQYTGAYAYPTVLSGKFLNEGHMNLDGWCHFVQNVSDGEVIVISRERTAALDYGVAGLMLAILTFFFLSLMAAGRGHGSTSRYYQNRISLVLYVSLFLTLIAMAGFSVWFVYKRNVSDMQNVMISRVNTLQGMMQERLRSLDSVHDSGARAEMESIGNSLHTDITLFDPSGHMAFSTTPEVYDRMILSQRIDDAPYYNIMYAHKRYFIQREKVGRRGFYSMYAPVFNSDGRMIAILTSPFTSMAKNFEAEAVSHIATVITIFFLLLLLSRVVTFEVVSRLFRPITELSRKMKVTDVDHLETLSYDGDDEITPLVNAYNRMVLDLGDSSRRLAQAERDKAWTDMARRVAHDLKNPLTPIKLQIQMLMRMKASGNPAWQDKLEEVAGTVLYHVDLLADSADQFSTFAKMYDQAPERFDLDALIRQEVELFDSRDDVQLDYFGLADAFVTAPRPQLTRVVVNLLTNAFQALSDGGRIQVALRNSSEEGFYDVVVEDSGPGVPEDMKEKIFSPDFTTKTSGSGLGLAICRRIADHCGGSISYSRSFTLGGACFTVKFPKG